MRALQHACTHLLVPAPMHSAACWLEDAAPWCGLPAMEMFGADSRPARAAASSATGMLVAPLQAPAAWVRTAAGMLSMVWLQLKAPESCHIYKLVVCGASYGARLWWHITLHFTQLCVCTMRSVQQILQTIGLASYLPTTWSSSSGVCCASGFRSCATPESSDDLKLPCNTNGHTVCASSVTARSINLCTWKCKAAAPSACGCTIMRADTCQWLEAGCHLEHLSSGEINNPVCAHPELWTKAVVRVLDLGLLTCSGIHCD